MWIKRVSQSHSRWSPQRKRSSSILTEFQWKYTTLLVGSAITATTLALGPTYYFIRQNYSIFTEASFDHAPQLLEHLQREQVWLSCLFIAMFLAVISFCLFFGVRITGRIAYPLMALEAHLKSLSRGYWSVPELKTRESDEFQSLISTYNYLYRFLKVKTKEEIKYLKSIQKETSSAETIQKIEKLINQKKSILVIPIDSSESDVQSRDERLAS